jgi:hypothetical protein
LDTPTIAQFHLDETSINYGLQPAHERVGHSPQGETMWTGWLGSSINFRDVLGRQFFNSHDHIGQEHVEPD